MAIGTVGEQWTSSASYYRELGKMRIVRLDEAGWTEIDAVKLTLAMSESSGPDAHNNLWHLYVPRPC